MSWNGFFEDLETQLAAEWEQERAALETETERLRIARLDLRSRLRTAAEERATAVVRAAGDDLQGTLFMVGADWLGLERERGFVAIPLPSLGRISLEHDAVLRSTTPVPESAVHARASFGFLCRDLARRRVPVEVVATWGERLPGTIDRAAADHLDLALHDPHTPRRAVDVRGFRLIPFHAIGYLSVTDVPSGRLL